MVKVFYVVAHDRGRPRHEFQRAWDALPAPELDGLRRYSQVTPLAGGDAEPGARQEAEETAGWLFGPPFPFGGVAELWFDRAEDWRRVAPAFDDVLARGLGPLFERERSQWVITEEHVVRPGPAMTDAPSTVKGLFFPRRKPDVPFDEFSEHWRETHAPLALETPNLVRYVQAPRVREGAGPDGPAAYDGVAQLWWESVADVEEAVASHTFQVTQPEDAASFVDASTLFGFLGTERRTRWPDGPYDRLADEAVR